MNSMARRKIAIFNLNATHRDPRVLRMGTTLLGLGHEVRVYEMLQPGLSERETVRGLDVHRIPIPQSYTDEDMAEIGRILPAAAEVIRGCHPWVYQFPGAAPAPEPEPVGWARVMRALKRRLRAGDEAVENPKEEMSERDHREILAIRSIMLVNLAIYKAARSFEPEIVHCNDLDTLLIGYMLKRTVKSVLVFDAHEIYPEQLAEHMRSDVWHSYYTNLETRLINEADGKLTVCESLGDYFKKVYKSPGFVTVRNLPSIRQISNDSILERPRERRKILYHGSYFAYRGLEEIIQAARHVERADFVFRGIGTHVESLKALTAKLGLEDRITFADPVGVDELVPSAADCDIGLSPFIPVCKNTEYALPNKFFEYLMAGLACASSDLVEIRTLTERHQVGVLFPSLEPEAIAGTLNDLLEHPDRIDNCRANALKVARQELNWETEVEKFKTFYQPYLA